MDDYIDRYQMPELYCYASDYPHPEGGRQPMVDVCGKLTKYAPEVMRKVFNENGEWLLPD